MKQEVRVMGIDDGPFIKRKHKKVLLVGTVFRGGRWMDGVLSTHAAVDGTDSTSKIARMVNRSKFKPQLQALFLHGIAVGGFNVIDVYRLHKLTRLPIIIIVRTYPDFEKIYAVLDRLHFTGRKRLIQKLPKPVKFGKIYVQSIGMDFPRVKELVRITCTRSFIPETLRASHLIAAGIIKGESRGRA